MTRVLVCGGRTFGLIPKDTASVDLSAAKTRAFHEAQFLWETLDQIHAEMPITFIVVSGGAGAAFLAHRWAMKRKVENERYIANWRPEGKQGPFNKDAGRENAASMIEEGKPDLVVAFRGGNSTSVIVDHAKEAGVRIVYPRQTDLEVCAKLFATAAHGAMGQNLINGKPYLTYLRDVVALVRSVPHSPETIASAWLCDVVHQTNIDIAAVQSAFGKVVAEMVSDVSTLIPAGEGAKSIRLAQIIATTQMRANAGHVPISDYLNGVDLILPGLKGGDPKLFDIATKALAEARAKAAA